MERKEILLQIQAKLQRLYDAANWYGYTERYGQRFYPYGLRKIASALKIDLATNCPA